MILSCAHRRKRWLQLSFNWSLTWDFPMADAHSMERGEQLKRSNLNGIVQSKCRLRHTVHDWILLADAQWPASLFCTHDSAWWLQLSFNWSLTWDFPMADAHSMERGEQLKRSNLNGTVRRPSPCNVYVWQLFPMEPLATTPVPAQTLQKPFSHWNRYVTRRYQGFILNGFFF